MCPVQFHLNSTPVIAKIKSLIVSSEGINDVFGVFIIIRSTRSVKSGGYQMYLLAIIIT